MQLLLVVIRGGGRLASAERSSRLGEPSPANATVFDPAVGERSVGLTHDLDGVIVKVVEILGGKRVAVLWVVIHARARAKPDKSLSGFS
jgi:hypothetical protein